MEPAGVRRVRLAVPRGSRPPGSRRHAADDQDEAVPAPSLTRRGLRRSAVRLGLVALLLLVPAVLVHARPAPPTLTGAVDAARSAGTWWCCRSRATSRRSRARCGSTP